VDNRVPDLRKPIDTVENHRMACWLFALVGAGLIGVAVYFYFHLTRIEATGEMIVWWRGYDQLYEAYGKWGVVNFHLVASGVFFTASAFALRTWRRLAREEKAKKHQRESREKEQ
jgi:hypothetical protein